MRDLAARDETLSSEDRAKAVHNDASRARDLLRRAVEAGDDPAAPYLLAWFLTAGPAVELRDPPEAIRIARGLLERAPARGSPGPPWAPPSTAPTRRATPSRRSSTPPSSTTAT